MCHLGDGCSGGGSGSGGGGGGGGGGGDNSSGDKMRGHFGDAGGNVMTNCDGALVIAAVVVAAGMVVGIAAAA